MAVNLHCVRRSTSKYAPVAVPSKSPRQGPGLTWVEVDLQKPHYLVWMLDGTLCLRFSTSTLDNKNLFSAPLGANALTFHLVPGGVLTREAVADAAEVTFQCSPRHKYARACNRALLKKKSFCQI